MTTIEMNRVVKRFGPTVAVARLSLTVNSGELLCLLGPSGCGKTTALRLLAGFDHPDSGEILVDGHDMTAVPVRKRGFGMVFQEYSLFPNLTARENIEFGPRVRHVSSAQRRHTGDRLIDLIRLGEHAEKYPHQLSGGQRQRVALARALATEPRLLLLDEPLSALDAKVREHLREEIRRLQRQLGVTTVFVTHDQAEAGTIADRIAVMNAGRLEQIGTMHEVSSAPVNEFVADFLGSAAPAPLASLIAA